MKTSSAKKKKHLQPHTNSLFSHNFANIDKGEGVISKVLLPSQHFCPRLSFVVRKKNQMETTLAHPKDLGQTKSTSRQASFRFSPKNNI